MPTTYDRVLTKTLIGCSIAVLAAFSSLRAESSPSGAERVVPRETKVLLLPPLDATVDSARLAPLRQQIVRLRQQSEFISRQFVLLGEAMAARAALAEPRLNLEDKQGRSAEMLDDLGQRTGADWVVSLVVKEIASDDAPGADVAKVFVHSTLVIQIRDTHQRLWLENRTHVGRLSGGGSPPEMFIESLETATEEALAGLLAPYSKVVPISKDGAIVDYLADQTAPFVGVPGTLFRGLRPPADQP